MSGAHHYHPHSQVVPLHRGFVLRKYRVIADLAGGRRIEHITSAVSADAAEDEVRDLAAGTIILRWNTRVIATESNTDFGDTLVPDTDAAALALELLHQAKAAAWASRGGAPAPAATTTPAPAPVAEPEADTGPSALAEMARILASTRSAATNAAPPSWPEPAWPLDGTQRRLGGLLLLLSCVCVVIAVCKAIAP